MSGQTLDCRLGRVLNRLGETIAYETRDGHFRIENGVPGGNAWRIDPLTEEARLWLRASGSSMFGRKRDAVLWLQRSIYGDEVST